LEKERLVDVLDRFGLLAHRRGERLQADGAPAELLGDRAEQATVFLVEAFVVDLERGERFARDGQGDHAVVSDLRVIADPLQPTIGDPRSSARAPCDLVRGRRVGLHLHDPRGAPHDPFESV